MHNDHLQAIEDAAKALGTERGTNAANFAEQYITGGRTSAAAAELSATLILKALDEGDPEVIDGFPTCDLSGQFADSPTVRDIADEILADLELEAVDDDDRAVIEDEVFHAYSDAFNAAVSETIEGYCRSHLAECAEVAA